MAATNLPAFPHMPSAAARTSSTSGALTARGAASSSAAGPPVAVGTGALSARGPRFSVGGTVPAAGFSSGTGDPRAAAAAERPAPAGLQYEGLWRGLGISSREPVTGKRANGLKQLHAGTNFDIGPATGHDRGSSTTHTSYADHGVVYPTHNAPDGNTSKVDLRQGSIPLEARYRTEQRERFVHPGPCQQRRGCKPAMATVHLGADARNFFTTQMKAAHANPTSMLSEETLRPGGLHLAAAGQNALARLPGERRSRPPRCNPIHGGPRQEDGHDAGVAAGMQFRRTSNNASAVVSEAHIRNPLLGHCTPREATIDHRSPEVVARANADVPPLRSLGALRPRSSGG